MKIKFIEIQNFRRLKSTRIDFDKETTIFVGANNSGKTSAMVALRYFLISPKRISIRDINLANWRKIDAIGVAWEQNEEPSETLKTLLPVLDIWLEVPLSEIHHVVHILPTIDWQGGLLGVRLCYESIAIEKLKADYLFERTSAHKVSEAGAGEKDKEAPRVWPTSLADFLEKNLSIYFDVQAYALDPTKQVPPDKGIAIPQELPDNAIPLDKNPIKSLIKIDEIAAQREFADAGDEVAVTRGDDKADLSSRRFKRKLSDQLRSYYDRHLDPAKSPSPQDCEALGAIQLAERNFDMRLKEGFAGALKELEGLGYPGLNNPKIKISTQLRATDGLKHGSAVQYEVVDPRGDETKTLHLPEEYSGLGYRNLISMVFMLMSFRDDWMRVGKAALRESDDGLERIQPLHLVLVEEPEVHLHAQVQQVFIKKAFALLRKHNDLGKTAKYATQLIISTHSSHVAHEADFSNLRYFRRKRAISQEETPTTTVSNLSYVFGDGDETQKFVKRYLKATHCDLFFADAAIFVEGQAERILVPHFIRYHFDGLSRRYLTLLDLGGSHAHKFKSLVDVLGLTTLIIADLDATQEAKVTKTCGSEAKTWRAAKPEKEKGQKTSNPVLKLWHPGKEFIDELLALKPDEHIALITDDFEIYVAFQKSVSSQIDETNTEEVIPRTFEDALVLKNLESLKSISGSSISNKISALMEQSLTGDDLVNELFELLKSAEKAAFALDCLMLENPMDLKPPNYINDGLSWLETVLERNEIEEPEQANA